jgi:hypothetical protein
MTVAEVAFCSASLKNFISQTAIFGRSFQKNVVTFQRGLYETRWNSVRKTLLVRDRKGV